jgi:molybdopterin-guanine dinucleotide biosynthesis protein A
MINANQNLAPYESFGVPVWPDEMQGHAGTLAGMQTGLIHCTTEYMVTAPCDSPFLPTDLVQRLAEGLLDAGADLAVAVTGEGAARQVHPVFCLMKASLLQHLTEYLRDGGRKIDAWYASINHVEVLFEDEAAFRNINTMAELKAYEPVRAQQ